MQPYIDLFAGLCGGVMCTVVGHPLDSVKVIMQTNAVGPCVNASASAREIFGLSGTLKTFKEVLYTQGLRSGLYAGVAPAIYASAAENACLFLFYGRILNLVENQKLVELPAFAKGATAGSIAAVLNSLVLCPTELFKCRMQAGVRAPIAKMAANIYRNEGIRGFFCGLGPTILREVPGNFAFFGVYEGVRSALLEVAPDRPNLVSFMSGGFGGIAFWLVALPADTVKSTMQIEGSGRISDVFKTVYRTQGMTGFYRGLTAVVLRAFPSNAALFITYDITKEALMSFKAPQLFWMQERAVA